MTVSAQTSKQAIDKMIYHGHYQMRMEGHGKQTGLEDMCRAVNSRQLIFLRRTEYGLLTSSSTILSTYVYVLYITVVNMDVVAYVYVKQ